MTIRILFVCLGNICRSPLAEAAFLREASALGLDVEIDSAGTGDWHIGHPPDPRAASVARKNGVDISHLRARQVTADDFHSFDHIVALDGQNLRDLERLRPSGSKAKLSLLMDHVDGRVGQAVADPYYGEEEHFHEAWMDVVEGARSLSKKINQVK